MNGILKLKRATLETEFVTDVMAAIGEDKFATKTDLTTKADKSEIESIKADLRDKANTADVVTKGEMDGAVAAVNEAVALKANAQDVTNALAGKQATLTSEQLSAIAAVSGKADAHEVTAALNGKADAAHTHDYAATDHNHDTAYAPIAHTHSDLATKQEVTDAVAAVDVSSQLQDYALKSDIPVAPDLSAYAKAQDVQDAIEGKQDKLPRDGGRYKIKVEYAEDANYAYCTEIAQRAEFADEADVANASGWADEAWECSYAEESGCAGYAMFMPYADIASVETTHINGTICIGAERINVIQRDDATNTPITINMPKVNSEINMPDYAVTFEVVLDYSRCTEGNTPETTFACRDENGDGEPDKEIHWLGGDGEPPDCSANKKHLLAFRWLMNEWLGCKQGEW